MAVIIKELGDCDFYLSLKTDKIEIGSGAVWFKQREPDKILTTLRSNLQELVSGCLRKNYHRFPNFSEQDGRTSRAKLAFDQSSTPRRYLAEKPPKGSILDAVLVLSEFLIISIPSPFLSVACC